MKRLSTLKKVFFFNLLEVSTDFSPLCHVPECPPSAPELEGNMAKPERKPSTKMPLCFVVKCDFILHPSRPLERSVHLETAWGSHMTLCKLKLVSQTEHQDAICHEVWYLVRSKRVQWALGPDNALGSDYL